MLQWMGGSRRKVANSRRSIQKRQKQYFEQRRRQQQHHEATFVENNDDGIVTCEEQKGNRSLDILSLLNVSETKEECRHRSGDDSVSTTANKATYTRSSELLDSTISQISRNTHSTLNHEATTTDHREPLATSTPSRHQVKTMGSESTWRNTSNITNTESRCQMNASSNKLSILDLIGEDVAVATSDGNPGHEAHVALSIEGLGNIGTETPMQSPQRTGRRPSGDQSSFTKAFKKPNPFNTMLEDIGMEVEWSVKNTGKPSCDDHLDPFPISEDVLSPFSCMDAAQSSPKDGIPLHKQFRMNSLHEEDRHCNFWNDGSGHDNKYEYSWRNTRATNNSYSWRNDSPGLKFEDSNFPLGYQKEMSDTFNVLDEGDCHFPYVDDSDSPSLMRNYGPQAGYIPHMPWEDPRDTLTSLSEESCSSSAVRAQDIIDARYSRNFVDDLQRPLKSSSKENHGEWMQSRAARSVRQIDDCDRSRKYSRSNLSHLKPASFSRAPFNEKLLDDDSWLLEEGFLLSHTNPHPSPFHLSLEKNRHRKTNLFSNDAEANLLGSSNSSFGRCEKDAPMEFSPEVPAFCQPFCSRQSLNSSNFPKSGSGESLLGLRRDFEIQAQSLNSLEDADFFGETESAVPIPELSAQGSVTEEGGTKTKSQPSAPEKMLQRSTGKKNITLDSKPSRDANFEDNSGSLASSEKAISQDATVCSSDEDVNKTPSFTKIPHGLEGEVIARELQASVPVKHQPNSKASKDDAARLAGKHLDAECHKGPEPTTVRPEPCCQVMMVERYVLQLRCLAKGKTAF